MIPSVDCEAIIVSDRHTVFMERAIREAERALLRGEFPVGCVIVTGDRVVAAGFRQRTAGPGASEIHHAEIIALKGLAHSGTLFDHRPMTLYTTLEPCLMCYGAILLSGIREIVYAFEDVMGGGTQCDLTRLAPLYRNRPVTLVPHVLREKSLSLLKAYFKDPKNRYWRESLLAGYTLSQ